MMISLFNMSQMYSSRTGAKQFNPTTANRYMVGRDVCPLTQTSSVGAARRDIIRAEGDDIRFTSHLLYDDAKRRSSMGGGVANFRTVDMSNPDEINSSKGNVLYKNDAYKIEGDGNSIAIYSRNEDGTWKEKPDQTYQIKEDTRVVWDASGAPQVLQGVQALSANGTLKAESANEIIIRKSDRDVEAGAGTVVFNASSKKGNFSGGDSVTYLGSYGEGSVITGGRGKNTYAGYFSGVEMEAGDSSGVYSGVFESITLEGGDLGNEFSGYFSGVEILGGNGKNSYAGMFLGGSKVQGGANTDNFNGRYVDSAIDGGEGDDAFGQGVNLLGAKVLSQSGNLYSPTIGQYGMYHAVAADFVDSDVVSGEGNNTVNSMVWGGKIELGPGNDDVQGAFIYANLDTGEGNDTISSMYSETSNIDSGNGINKVTLATARNNNVTTGQGHTDISMGVNPGSASDFGVASFGKTTFSSRDEYKENLDGTVHIGIRFGELEGNRLNAEKGSARVKVHNGSDTQSVVIDYNKRNAAEKEAAAEEAAAEEQKSANKAAPSGRDNNGAPAPSAKPDAEAASPHAALMESLSDERFVMVSGNGPEKDGGSALKIKTGVGEDIDLRYNARTNIESKVQKDQIRTFARRYNGYKSYMI